MIKDSTLFDALAGASLRTLETFKTQNLSNMAWAFAKLGEADEELMTAIAEAALARISGLSPTDLATIAWAFAKLGLRDDELMEAISEAALAKMHEFSATSLANLAWAYAMLGILDVPLMQAISSQALKKLADFEPHDIAYLAWAYAQHGVPDLPFLAALAAAARRHLDEFAVEDLSKSAWSWATLGKATGEIDFSDLAGACCARARLMRPVSTWNSDQNLETGHALTWSAWTIGMPELGWSIFEAWASQGMAFDTTSFGLLLMDSAFCKKVLNELGIMHMMKESCAFDALKNIFAWAGGGSEPVMPGYAMRFDTRTCPGSNRERGTHSKLAHLVVHVQDSSARDAPSILEAIREFSNLEGSWLKVAGGGKANIIENALRSRPSAPCEVTLEFGVFVGYTTTRIGMRAAEDAGSINRACPLVVGLEVEPVHVCVARWIVDLAGLSKSVEVWAGIANDSLLRVGDELGGWCVRLLFMDHRGTKFHEDLVQLEQHKLLAPATRIIADNVLKPGAPIFCWVLNNSSSYDTINWAVGEFVQYYVEDWMVVADYRGAGGTAPPAPPELHRLAWDSDKWRRKSESDSVRISEWAMFSQHAREVYLSCGLEAQPWFN